MFEFPPPQIRLRGSPRLSERDARQIAADFETFRDGLPRPLESYILDTFGINLASVYGGRSLKNPFGKASGQLSLALHQIERDAAAGLGFVVLKTVIAQDQSGEQTMREWAIPETRMLVEPIRGRNASDGWTVTWKGRGWFDSFEAYCELFDNALIASKGAGMLIAPSVKYHLPTPDESFWKEEEYVFTTGKLLEIWSRYHGDQAMPLEKDFSPTLAGSSRAAQQVKILEWLHTVPLLIHRAAPGRVVVGLKLFNTLFEDDFQVHMLEAVCAALPGENRADFLVYANRLFDPARTFEGKLGVAYGGPDLSDRNLAVLEQFLSVRHGQPREPGSPSDALLPLSATGNIHCGRIAAEYLLRGASSFQIHTLFQLPDSEFEMRTGNKTEKALHRLLFHPQEGFLAWVLDLRERFGFSREASVCDMANWCRENWSAVAESLGCKTAE
jgi:hypothetical protein